MKAVEGMGETANEILKAVKEVRFLLVRVGAMANESLSIASIDLLPLDKYVKASNRG